MTGAEDGEAERGGRNDGSADTDGVGSDASGVDIPAAVERAFADHGSFERDGDGWASTTTAFDGTVRVAPAGGEGGERGEADGRGDEGGDRVRYTVTVRVPTLSAVTEGEVAAVVEDGWAETFERRVVDVGGVTRRERSFDPTVAVGDESIAVTYGLTDANARRGVDDAAALIDFVEGTYVQGAIPGYEYTDPVADLLSAARRQGGGGPA